MKISATKLLQDAGLGGLSGLLARCGKNYAEPPRPDRCYFHITHPKAASQWIQDILSDLYPDAVVKNLPAAASVQSGQLQPGKFYTSVYLSREEFLNLGAPAGTPHFFIMRDLRDSLVSLYFSLSKSHAITDEHVQRGRLSLAGLGVEEGLRVLIQENAWNFVRIQSSWLREPECCFRFEDVVLDPEQFLGRILRDVLHLKIRQARLRKVCKRHSFERMSGGRQLGQEDPNAHLRSGKPGDWRRHFTPDLIRLFKELHGQHLIDCGYETDLNW
jgi:hypothetical protein